jgi:hypothetical protein
MLIEGQKAGAGFSHFYPVTNGDDKRNSCEKWRIKANLIFNHAWASAK